MKYLLSHRTSYSYTASVDSAHHIAHLRARAFPGQKVSSISIAIAGSGVVAMLSELTFWPGNARARRWAIWCALSTLAA